MKIRFGLVSFLILGVLLLFIVNIPLLLRAIFAPPKTFFTFVHTVEVDYFLYLAMIRAGLHGLWTAPAVYTSEETKNSLIYLYLILVGKMASPLHLSPIFAYHLARIISVLLMLAGIYKVSEKVMERKWAFWAALVGFLATIPPFMMDRSLFNINVPVPWWYVFDPVARLDYLPHHAFGLAALFFAVYFLFEFIKQKRVKFILAASLSLFIAGFVFPPVGLVMAIGFPLSITLYQIKAFIRRQPIDGKFILASILIFLSAILALLIIREETQKGFPWSQWRDWDMGMWNRVPNFNRDFVLAGGIILLIALPTMVKILLNGRDFIPIFITFWALLPYILLPFTDLLGIGKIRLAFLGNFLPLGIIAVITIQKLGASLPKAVNRHNFFLFCLSLFLFISLPVSFSFYKERLPQKKYQADEYPQNNYVPSNMLDSMLYLDKNIKPYKVVLANFTVGNMLPAFAPAKTYLGSWTQTKDYWQKIDLMSRFYSGKMTKTEAHEFIKNSRIDYIYLGISEKIIGEDITHYQLPLSDIYHKDGITIYKVLRENI